jgi:hypothetical protein
MRALLEFSWQGTGEDLLTLSAGVGAVFEAAETSTGPAAGAFFLGGIVFSGVCRCHIE